MNTSKSLDEILDDFDIELSKQAQADIPKAYREAKQAIVEAVEGLINDCPKAGFYSQGDFKPEYIRIKDLRKAIKEWQNHDL